MFRWVFRIILHYQSFLVNKVCINNKCCFIRHLLSMKLKYFSSFRRQNSATKIFIFACFLQLKFIFSSKWMKTIQASKITIMICLLLMQIFFFIARQCCLSLFGIIKTVFFFSIWALFWDVGRIYCLNKTWKAVVRLFSSVFSNHLFLINHLFLPSYIDL